MPFTEEEVNALNRQECAYPLAFFKTFAQDITVYEDDDIWVVDKPAGLLSVDGKNLYPSNPGSAAPLPNHGRPACHGSRKQQNQVWRALEDLGFALIYSIYLSPLNHHLFRKGAPLS